jgi:hypothetical protein
MYNQAGVVLGLVALVLFVFLWSMFCYRVFNGGMGGWKRPVFISTYITLGLVGAIGLVAATLEQ